MIEQIVNKFGGRLKMLGALAITLVALSATAGSAFALEPDEVDPETVRELIVQLNNASDPDAAFAQLTPEQQEAVIEALSVATIEVIEEVVVEEVYNEDDAQDSVGADSETCKTHTVKIVSSDADLYKPDYWTYKSKTHWCFDGSVITKKPHFTRGAETHFIGWEFVGHVDKSESGGRDEWMYEDFTEGHFRWCITDLGCLYNNYPDITKRQYGNGDYDSDTGY